MILLPLRLYLARLVCWRIGHRRGKRVSPVAVECPRCGAVRPRVQRKKEA